mmetsp:Transcript_11792/g.21539  ORF Transcript_11792/g.21539 Transcript_11792/m.21539 type:complete len:213 (-) Transcript_11792:306-944(-)
MELISQGAEARIYKTSFNAMPAILKERFAKNYRHPELEKRLTKMRMTQEVRCNTRAAKAGVATPTVYNVDMVENKILMEYVHGVPLREVFDGECTNKYDICEQLGLMIAKLHNVNIVHGDLTTSNVLLKSSQDETLVLIDFGLAKSNASTEDKAVDMYVLERAFSSTHPGSQDLFDKVVASYTSALSDKTRAAVITRLKQVQQRGRKREMIG